MASTTAADIAGFMGIDAFDANTSPTSTQIGAYIDEAENLISLIEVTVPTPQLKILTKLRVAAWVARAQSLIDETAGVPIADSYIGEYDRIVKDLRASDMFNVPNSNLAYGNPRKVNR